MSSDGIDFENMVYLLNCQKNLRKLNANRYQYDERLNQFR